MKYLAELINNYNYTEKTIAKEINVTVPTVYNWLNGNNQISKTNMLKLKKLLNQVKVRRKGNQSKKEINIKKRYTTSEAAEIMGIERKNVNSLINSCLPEDYKLSKIEIPETGNYIFDLTSEDIEILSKALELKNKMSNKEVKNEISKILNNNNSKVLIPSYVAKMIEKTKKEGRSILNFRSYVWHQKNGGSDLAIETHNWMAKHRTENGIDEVDNKIVRAWLDGYELEEKQYVIIIAEQSSMKKNKIEVWSCYVELTIHLKNGQKSQYKGIDDCYLDPTKERNIKFSKEEHANTNSVASQYIKYKFTEQEIKDIDERYWAFAKPIDMYQDL